MVKTMEWQGQSLLLLDQTKLPSEIITILCESKNKARYKAYEPTVVEKAT